MAKKSSKTDAVKKVLAANPKMTPRVVVETLKKKDVEVTPAYVSTIKSNLKKSGELTESGLEPKPKAKRRGRPKGSGKKAAAKTSISVADLQAAKALIDSTGSIDSAMEALNTLSSLREN